MKTENVAVDELMLGVPIVMSGEMFTWSEEFALKMIKFIDDNAKDEELPHFTAFRDMLCKILENAKRETGRA